jgi:hypothetical protein
MIRIEFHLHTYHSPDSLLTMEEIVQTCRRRQINAVVVADHNTIQGALELQNFARERLQVVVAEEVLTSEGEIMGLFLKEPIPPGLTPRETVDRIREQGGLVLIPHPTDRLRRSRLNGRALQEVLPLADMVEIYNSRTIFEIDNHKALALACEHDLAKTAGSDAHLQCEIGRSYGEMEAFTDAAGFLQNLKAVKLYPKKSSLLVHFSAKPLRFFRKRFIK